MKKAETEYGGVVSSSRYSTISTKFLYLVISITLFSPPDALSQNLSSIPASHVDIGVGARGMALAGAYSAVVNDATAIFWNPSGLSEIEGKSMFLAHARQFGLIPYNAMAVGFGIGGQHGIAGGAILSGNDELEETTILLGYGLQLKKLSNKSSLALHTGLNLKWHSSSFGNNEIVSEDFPIFSDDELDQARAEQVQGSASGLGVDWGAKLYTANNFYYAVTWMNVLSSLSWNNGQAVYSESIPGKLSFAAAYQPQFGSQIAMELIRDTSKKNRTKLRFGLERKILSYFQVRGGLEQLLADHQERRYSLGLGFLQDIEPVVRLQIDFAYLIHPITNTQRFSLVMNF